MITLHLTRADDHAGVYLHLPASPAEIENTFALFDGNDADSTKIIDVVSEVQNLHRYISSTDVTIPENIEKLNTLAENINKMTKQQKQIFSGALDAESINSIDDVLRISESTSNYVFLPNVTTERELGRFLVDTGYKNFPEDVRQYLDYYAIGAEYYADNGGAFGADGYVKRKSQEQKQETEPVFTLYLHSEFTAANDMKPHSLEVPANSTQLAIAEQYLCSVDFKGVKVAEVVSHEPYFDGMIPFYGADVYVLDKLAENITEMKKTDGELLKFLSVLEVEAPETAEDALRLSMKLDDYERVLDNDWEYGEAVLRSVCGDQEVFDTIEGFINYAEMGAYYKLEHGVRQTEFGLVRRLSEPFSEPETGQKMV